MKGQDTRGKNINGKVVVGENNNERQSTQLCMGEG